MSWAERTARVQKAATRVFREENVFLDFYGIGPSSEPVPAIYREPHVAVRTDVEAEIQSSRPTLDIRRADLPRDPNPPEIRETADHVIVRGERFRIDESQEDGEGMLKLFLVETNKP